MKLTIKNIEKFIEKYKLDYGNAEIEEQDGKFFITVEAPHNWTHVIFDSSLKKNDVIDDDEFLQIIKDNLDELDYENYFDEMYPNVINQFRPSEFLQMLKDDEKFFRTFDE
jgi:alanine-alpha-ketoisovalerate/valine-pyruvate aminotransferase